MLLHKISSSKSTTCKYLFFSCSPPRCHILVYRTCKVGRFLDSSWRCNFRKRMPVVCSWIPSEWFAPAFHSESGSQFWRTANIQCTGPLLSNIKLPASLC